MNEETRNKINVYIAEKVKPEIKTLWKEDNLIITYNCFSFEFLSGLNALYPILGIYFYNDLFKIIF